MTKQQNKKNIGKYDKFIPWYFVIFFVFLAIIDGSFVYLATSTHRGVVDKNYYETGLKYNEVLANEKKQAQLGWIVDVNFKNNQRLEISLKDSNDNVISNADVTAKIIRPTSSGYDFTVDFSEIDNKYYMADIDFPLKGVWDIEINISKNDNIYKKIKRVVVNN